MENWNISPHKKGNTFGNKKITFPFSIKRCKINMKFTNFNVRNDVIEWSTENNTLIKETDYRILMKSRLLNVPIGTYSADVNVTFEDGSIQTYFTANLQII